MNYLDLLNETARRTNLPVQTVKIMLSAVVEIMLERFADMDKVIIRGLGVFRMKRIKSFLAGGKSIPVVRFKASSVAKEQFKEE